MERRPHGAQTVPHGKEDLGSQIGNTWGPDLCPRSAGRGCWHMKHFHLSQGDKRAGLERPLYLQKKIKSALTLAPLIGNTCWLVIVLNSLWSRSRVFAPARDGRGICMEFLPIQRLREGTFLGPSGRGVLRAGFPASRGETLPVVLPEGGPGAPFPSFSPGAGEQGKDQRTRRPN